MSNFTFQNRPTNTIPGVGISTVAGDDFEANQTGNNVTVDATSVTVNSGPLAGNVYPAVEGAGNQPRFADTGPLTGEAVWIGRACNGDPILNASDFDPGDIAIVRRGVCFFGDKLANAAALGAAAIVIANNIAVDTVWGGVRIWDYSDPENPVLASTFNTVCSANPSAIGCDPRGTYSVHNVIVERDRAYFSWYSDGVLILDISDPYNPVEVARYHQEGPEFEAGNGGIQNFWGIYKEPNSPWIYASDRNGGLYVLKEYGVGTLNACGRDTAFWQSNLSDPAWNALGGPNASFFNSGKTNTEVLATNNNSAYYDLAKAYIAASLNVAAGTDPMFGDAQDVRSVLAWAETLLSSANGDRFSSGVQNDARRLAVILNTYNAGLNC